MTDPTRPGRATTLRLVGGSVAMTPALVVQPRDVEEIVVEGDVLARAGAPTGAAVVDDADRWVGTWIDRAHALEQHLLADGRYSETRGGRVDAWTGQWWARGARIVYLDDTGFWAFGELDGSTLVHAHFRMRR